MQYYRIHGLFANAEERLQAERQNKRKDEFSISTKLSEYQSKNMSKHFITIVNMEAEKVSFGALMIRENVLEATFKDFISFVGIELSDFSYEEITLSEFHNLLRKASRSDYIDDEDPILEYYKLDELVSHWGGRSIRFDENLIKPAVRKDLEKACYRYFATQDMLPELKRIYKGKGKTLPHGHPVHYLIETDDATVRRELYRILLSALHDAGRIQNARYAYVNIVPSREEFAEASFENLYQTGCGGAIVTRFIPSDDMDEGHFAAKDRGILTDIAKVLSQYKNDVLTILCVPKECVKLKEILFENMHDICFIEIKEDLADIEDARSYLKFMAKERDVRTDKYLFENLDDCSEYTAKDLAGIFDSWYDKKLRTQYYPQYRDSVRVKAEIMASKPKGTAYSQLREMIGLSAAKDVIEKSIIFYKAQKLFREKGMIEDHPSMHMVFTGNPGTAKTSVARLFAEIMRDNGILSSGHLVEVGRMDLVGKYVGHTAQQTRKKFMEAKGGVLFIDEAYALASEHNGSFGQEAIDTLVQLMENCREDTIVIFAGYPDKMKEFLKTNPGLRSRIAFHINFEDYNTEELCRISQHIANAKGLVLENEALDKLESIFEKTKDVKDRGNGRFARNLIEKARMAQSQRLIDMDFDSVTKEDIATIKACDIQEIDMKTDNTKHRIGFCA